MKLKTILVLLAVALVFAGCHKAAAQDETAQGSGAGDSIVETAAEDADVISVMLKIPHTEGSLYRLLTKFYVNGMNLIRLENRPIKDGSFDVWFYLDFNGSLKDPSVKALICDLRENLEYFRVLGTFKSN